MEKKTYITEEERTKCQKVADAFAELYEMADIVVVSVGRYGFVMLKYYTPPHGFEEDETFTDSMALFEALWQEWLDMKLYLIAKGTPLLEKDVSNKEIDREMDSVGAGIVGMSYNWLCLWNCRKPCLQDVGKLLLLFHRL